MRYRNRSRCNPKASPGKSTKSTTGSVHRNGVVALDHEFDLRGNLQLRLLHGQFFDDNLDRSPWRLAANNHLRAVQIERLSDQHPVGADAGRSSDLQYLAERVCDDYTGAVCVVMILATSNLLALNFTACLQYGVGCTKDLIHIILSDISVTSS